MMAFDDWWKEEMGGRMQGSKYLARNAWNAAILNRGVPCTAKPTKIQDAEKRLIYDLVQAGRLLAAVKELRTYRQQHGGDWSLKACRDFVWTMAGIQL